MNMATPHMPEACINACKSLARTGTTIALPAMRRKVRSDTTLFGISSGQTPISLMISLVVMKRFCHDNQKPPLPALLLVKHGEMPLI